MQAIETAWKQFYQQFTPHVFTDGESIDDPQEILFPRITFSYSMGDFLADTLSTFQVWDLGTNSARLWGICNQISEAVSVVSGTAIFIPGEIYYEYELTDGTVGTVDTGEEMNRIIATGNVARWEEKEGESAGSIEIRRGNPFLTPSPKDEPRIHAMYGTLACRYYNIV